MNLRRWLQPGIGVKRWLLVVFGGLLLMALGVAHTIRQVTRDLQPGGLTQVVVDLVTLQFLPFPLRGIVVGAAGLALVGFGAWRLARALTEPLRADDGDRPLAEVLYQKRMLARGPRVVAIGGGTGLSTLLRGMKERTSNLTAIVTVADDGGSSGALRDELGIPPVGDIRNCIAALADAEPLMGDLLGYRFPGGLRPLDGPVETEPGGLGGHAMGNLLLAALTALEDGDFEEGVRRMNRVLAVRGQVVPASATPITLMASTGDDVVVRGQSTIMRTPGIRRVWTDPAVVPASADALAAIRAADVVVLGPGSLYTSVLPVLLIPAIRDAVIASSGLRIYVCNVATQVGETEGYDVADHVEALVAHTASEIVDVVLVNGRFDGEPTAWPRDAVAVRWPPALDPVPQLVTAAVASPRLPHHHDPSALAAAILRAADADVPARRRGRMADTA